jgi:hypothetical protein
MNNKVWVMTGGDLDRLPAPYPPLPGPASLLLSLLDGQALGRIGHIEGTGCTSVEEVRSVVDEVVSLALDCGSQAAAGAG